MQNIIKSEKEFEKLKKTILLVEDEVVTAMAQAQFLANSGYNVIQANDGDTAVSMALENGDIDLVLMDIDLGSGINGTRAAELILSGRDIPIVFLTSHAEKEMVQMVKNITRYGYVIKDSGEFVLLSSIEMAFELFQAHRNSREREEHLDVTLQSIADCVISTDVNGNIVRMNRAAENLTGWTFNEAAGENLYDVLHVTEVGSGESDGQFCDRIPHIDRKGEWRNKLLLKSKNGEVYRIDKSSSPIRDTYGNIRGRVVIFRDVTGEHETQKALMERGALMRGLFENMPSGAVIYRISNDGSKASDYIITDANSTSARFQRCERDDLIGRSLDEVRPDVEKLNVLPFYRRVWETGVTESFPTKIYKNNRIVFWFDNYAFKLPTGEIVTLYRDVSVQKRAEEALRESEERYRLLAENTADNIWTMDLNLKFNYSSPSVIKLRGYTEEEALHQSIEDIVTPESLDVAINTLKDELDNDLPEKDPDRIKRLVLEHYHKDGRKIWLESNLSFLRDPYGKPNGILGVTRDITDRKMTEDALRRSEEKLHLIMDGIPAFMAYVDNSERYVYVNKAYAEWHGKTKEDFPGRSLKEIIDQSYYLKAEPFYSKVFNGERVVYENTLADRNGKEHILKVEYVPHISSGVVNGFFALVIDITEQKRAEERILGLLKEKELLLKEVHHRIKNNMGSIASLLYLQSDTLEDAASIEAITDARNRVISMMGLYEMLYRSEDCRSVSVFEYLCNLIDKISSTFIGDARISIEKDIDDFKLDSSKLFPVGMIINELFTNALKYAFPGRKSGSIEVRMKKLSARTVEVMVRDSGIGLPEEVKMGRAKGFGISLVNMLVQQLNGKLSIGKNDGTEFRVSFMV
ncbi:MAG TPA: PAS domain S-box protein [Spirochaetota bacterium]|nr:PAS domain S-box protein [Spirochaetota bacterium]HPJ35295.1 PAS domain S-box protein [Spirochaetota bacterium]